ncbi:hypothetical protein [Fusobacterium sp. HC1336]|uniref:hypothetical protein n=1 Tax=Fusobacterium sp. HC1336 TaxID=3171169 RepID=UPI003F219975
MENTKEIIETIEQEIKEQIEVEKEVKEDKEDRLQQILEKKEKKQPLSLRERIILDEYELKKKKLKLIEEDKKNRKKWANNIVAPVLEKLKKIYDDSKIQIEESDLDMKLSAILIYALENQEMFSDINPDEFLLRNKNKKIILKKGE